MLLIRNSRVVDPATGTDRKLDLLLSGNMIDTVAEQIDPASLPADTEVIEAEGLVTAPGLIDPHVHFRDPGFPAKEDILSGAEAAKRGGFTTVVCMANTRPVVDDAAKLQANQQKGEQTGIHVLHASALTKGLQGKQLVEMEQMAEAGCALFTDDGMPVMDEKLLFEAMERAAELDLPISLHEEDPAFISGAGVHPGLSARRLGYGGASPLAEESMVARDCMLALHSGAAVCIQHISSGRSVELVREAKRMGADIHAEATPHHFTLTEEDVLRYGTNARMNPPLRTEEDRRMIIRGLMDGTIDMIATDHAPHTAEEKGRPLPDAPSGIIGLETALSLGIRSLVQPGYLTLMQLLEKMTLSPALFLRMTPPSVAPGESADLVLFAENETWTADHFVSRSSNSPFLGWTLPGRIHFTICGGACVYRPFPVYK